MSKKCVFRHFLACEEENYLISPRHEEEFLLGLFRAACLPKGTFGFPLLLRQTRATEKSDSE